MLVLVQLLLINLVFSESTLRQIHVLFRHGERTPSKDNMYPKDPYVNDTWYPYGLGALTNKGRVTMFNVGYELREKYDEFLGHIYNPEEIYARSTSYPRTKMSMQLVLAGLWEPVSVQQWQRPINCQFNWQPIDYVYEKYEVDKLLGFPISYCPELYDEYAKLLTTNEVKNALQENANEIKYINENSGLNISTFLDLLTLYLGLVAENTERPHTLPLWTKEVFPEFLKNAANFEYKIQSSSNILVKATGGPLVKKLIEDADNGINNNIFSPKLFLYSGHEYNIAYVLSALKVFQPHIPPFGSYLAFELHKIKDKYSFKILYKKGNNNPIILLLPGCDEFCDLETFKNITKDVIPEHEWC